MCVCVCYPNSAINYTDMNLEQLQCYLHVSKLEQTVVC